MTIYRFDNGSLKVYSKPIKLINRVNNLYTKITIAIASYQCFSWDMLEQALATMLDIVLNLDMRYAYSTDETWCV